MNILLEKIQKKKARNFNKYLNFPYLSTDVSGVGVTAAFSFSVLFIDAPAVVAGAVVDCPAGISSGSSGHPKASLVLP